MASVFPDYLSTKALSWACLQHYAEQRLHGKEDSFYALSLMFAADCLQAQMTRDSFIPTTLSECEWARSQEGDYIEPFFNPGDWEGHDGWLDVKPEDISPKLITDHIFSTKPLFRTIAAANQMSPAHWKQMVHALPVCLEAMKCKMVGVDPACEVKQRRYLIALPNEVLEIPDFEADRAARLPVPKSERLGEVIHVDFGLGS